MHGTTMKICVKMCLPFGTAMDMEIHKCEIVRETAGEG
jgi:hypothetical protein